MDEFGKLIGDFEKGRMDRRSFIKNAVAIGVTLSSIGTFLSAKGIMGGETYTNHNIPMIIVGMVSIGTAGYLCSSLIRWLGVKAMPWEKVWLHRQR